jgi:tRNA(Ser,Leu) C12 N-acetylase TAN1
MIEKAQALLDAQKRIRCQQRGGHKWQTYIDPESGAFQRCKDCGIEVDLEDPDGDLQE